MVFKVKLGIWDYTEIVNIWVDFLSSTFSIIFERGERILIRRYEEGDFGGLPDL